MGHVFSSLLKARARPHHIIEDAPSSGEKAIVWLGPMTAQNVEKLLPMLHTFLCNSRPPTHPTAAYNTLLQQRQCSAPQHPSRRNDLDEASAGGLDSTFMPSPCVTHTCERRVKKEEKQDCWVDHRNDGNCVSANCPDNRSTSNDTNTAAASPDMSELRCRDEWLSYCRWRRCFCVWRRAIHCDTLMLALLFHSGCLWSPCYDELHDAQRTLHRRMRSAESAGDTSYTSKMHLADSSNNSGNHTANSTRLHRDKASNGHIHRRNAGGGSVHRTGHSSDRGNSKQKRKRHFSHADHYRRGGVTAQLGGGGGVQETDTCTDALLHLWSVACPASVWALNVLHYLRLVEVYSICKRRRRRRKTQRVVQHSMRSTVCSKRRGREANKTLSAAASTATASATAETAAAAAVASKNKRKRTAAHESHGCADRPDTRVRRRLRVDGSDSLNCTSFSSSSWSDSMTSSTSSRAASLLDATSSSDCDSSNKRSDGSRSSSSSSSYCVSNRSHSNSSSSTTSSNCSSSCRSITIATNSTTDRIGAQTMHTDVDRLTRMVGEVRATSTGTPSHFYLSSALSPPVPAATSSSSSSSSAAPLVTWPTCASSQSRNVLPGNGGHWCTHAVTGVRSSWSASSAATMQPAHCDVSFVRPKTAQGVSGLCHDCGRWTDVVCACECHSDHETRLLRNNRHTDRNNGTGNNGDSSSNNTSSSITDIVTLLEQPYCVCGGCTAMSAQAAEGTGNSTTTDPAAVASRIRLLCATVTLTDPNKPLTEHVATQLLDEWFALMRVTTHADNMHCSTEHADHNTIKSETREPPFAPAPRADHDKKTYSTNSNGVAFELNSSSIASIRGYWFASALKFAAYVDSATPMRQCHVRAVVQRECLPESVVTELTRHVVPSTLMTFLSEEVMRAVDTRAPRVCVPLCATCRHTRRESRTNTTVAAANQGGVAFPGFCSSSSSSCVTRGCGGAASRALSERNKPADTAGTITPDPAHPDREAGQTSCAMAPPHAHGTPQPLSLPPLVMLHPWHTLAKTSRVSVWMPDRSVSLSAGAGAGQTAEQTSTLVAGQKERTARGDDCVLQQGSDPMHTGASPSCGASASCASTPDARVGLCDRTIATGRFVSYQICSHGMQPSLCGGHSSLSRSGTRQTDYVSNTHDSVRCYAWAFALQRLYTPFARNTTAAAAEITTGTDAIDAVEAMLMPHWVSSLCVAQQHHELLQLQQQCVDSADCDLLPKLVTGKGRNTSKVIREHNHDGDAKDASQSTTRKTAAPNAHQSPHDTTSPDARPRLWSALAESMLGHVRVQHAVPRVLYMRVIAFQGEKELCGGAVRRDRPHDVCASISRDGSSITHTTDSETTRSSSLVQSVSYRAITSSTTAPTKPIAPANQNSAQKKPNFTTHIKSASHSLTSAHKVKTVTTATTKITAPTSRAVKLTDRARKRQSRRQRALLRGMATHKPRGSGLSNKSGHHVTATRCSQTASSSPSHRFGALHAQRCGRVGKGSSATSNCGTARDGKERVLTRLRARCGLAGETRLVLLYGTAPHAVTRYVTEELRIMIEAAQEKDSDSNSLANADDVDADVGSSTADNDLEEWGNAHNRALWRVLSFMHCTARRVLSMRGLLTCNGIDTIHGSNKDVSYERASSNNFSSYGSQVAVELSNAALALPAQRARRLWCFPSRTDELTGLLELSISLTLAALVCVPNCLTSDTATPPPMSVPLLSLSVPSSSFSCKQSEKDREPSSKRCKHDDTGIAADDVPQQLTRWTTAMASFVADLSLITDRPVGRFVVAAAYALCVLPYRMHALLVATGWLATLGAREIQCIQWNRIRHHYSAVSARRPLPLPTQPHQTASMLVREGATKQTDSTDVCQGEKKDRARQEDVKGRVQDNNNGSGRTSFTITAANNDKSSHTAHTSRGNSSDRVIARSPGTREAGSTLHPWWSVFRTAALHNTRVHAALCLPPPPRPGDTHLVDMPTRGVEQNNNTNRKDVRKMDTSNTQDDDAHRAAVLMSMLIADVERSIAAALRKCQQPRAALLMEQHTCRATNNVDRHHDDSKNNRDDSSTNDDKDKNELSRHARAHVRASMAVRKDSGDLVGSSSRSNRRRERSGFSAFTERGGWRVRRTASALSQEDMDNNNHSSISNCSADETNIEPVDDAVYVVAGDAAPARSTRTSLPKLSLSSTSLRHTLSKSHPDGVGDSLRADITSPDIITRARNTAKQTAGSSDDAPIVVTSSYLHLTQQGNSSHFRRHGSGLNSCTTTAATATASVSSASGSPRRVVSLAAPSQHGRRDGNHSATSVVVVVDSNNNSSTSTSSSSYNNSYPNNVENSINNSDNNAGYYANGDGNKKYIRQHSGCESSSNNNNNSNSSSSSNAVITIGNSSSSSSSNSSIACSDYARQLGSVFAHDKRSSPSNGVSVGKYYCYRSPAAVRGGAQAHMICIDDSDNNTGALPYRSHAPQSRPCNDTILGSGSGANQSGNSNNMDGSSKDAFVYHRSSCASPYSLPSLPQAFCRPSLTLSPKETSDVSRRRSGRLFLGTRQAADNDTDRAVD